MIANTTTSVSLVLGSGGARGLAHIGVIHELRSKGYEIKSISGCYMGALVGGIFAAGKLDEFEHWVKAISKVDIVSLLDIAWQKHGLVKGDKIINTLVELVGDNTIEELPMPYTAVAADVKNEKEIWINSGRLFDANRASISLPLLFTPVDYKNGHLIDGGVLNPVPIAPTFNDDTDLTVAVNLGGLLEIKPKTGKKQQSGTEESSSFREKVTRYIDELQDSVKTRAEGDWGAARRKRVYLTREVSPDTALLNPVQNRLDDHCVHYVCTVYASIPCHRHMSTVYVR